MTATSTALPVASAADLRDALAFRREGDVLLGRVEPAWDVFTIPHGGHLTALAGSAALTASERPDLFTLTVHFLRKAAPGPLRVEAHAVGGSRRFTSWSLTFTQDGHPIMTALASVGDREPLDGPAWTDRPARTDADVAMSPPAGTSGEPFPTPAVAQRMGQQLELATAGFARGETGDEAVVRSRLATTEPDQLAALLACDVTPPAVWNALGAQGWVPTLELTAHVRARPAPGPLTVEATTHHVSDGFLEEDALVHDATGTLVVQSRQLARWTNA